MDYGIRHHDGSERCWGNLPNSNNSGLDVYYTSDAFSVREGSRDGLDFRLAGGLDLLGSLKMLEALLFGDLWQEMSEQDVEWMMKTWSQFSYIQG